MWGMQEYYASTLLDKQEVRVGGMGVWGGGVVGSRLVGHVMGSGWGGDVLGVCGCGVVRWVGVGGGDGDGWVDGD